MRGVEAQEWSTLIFSYTRKRSLGPIFAFKILNFNIFGVFRKMNISFFFLFFWGGGGGGLKFLRISWGSF